MYAWFIQMSTGLLYPPIFFFFYEPLTENDHSSVWAERASTQRQFTPNRTVRKIKQINYFKSAHFWMKWKKYKVWSQQSRAHFSPWSFSTLEQLRQLTISFTLRPIFLAVSLYNLRKVYWICYYAYFKWFDDNSGKLYHVVQPHFRLPSLSLFHVSLLFFCQCKSISYIFHSF